MSKKDELLELALTEVGYLEKSCSAYNKDHSIIYKKRDGAGSDNITKYNFEMHKIYPQTMDFAAAWCDSFVDWCFYTIFGVTTAKSLLGGFDDYTVASASKYKQMNAYHYGTKDIAPGDQIFFKNSTRIHHTGIVVAVDDRSVYTVEGNTSPQGSTASVEANGGGVWTKEYPLSYSKIDGYGRPPYEKHIEPEYPRWIKEGKYWYYRVAKNKNAHGWMIINGHWYYFGPDGRMYAGINEIESEAHGSEIYYFLTSGDYEGALCKSDDRGALKIWDLN